MKTKPVPVKGASAEQLARGLNSLHTCLDDTQTKVDTVLSRQAEIQTEQTYIKGVLDGMATRFGSPTTAQVAGGHEPTQHRTIASIRPWHAVAAVAAVIGATQGLQLLLKWIGELAPVVWHTLTTVH